MKKRSKIMIGLALGLLVLLIAAALLLPRLVDLDRYRPELARRASEKLGREVEIGPLELRLLPFVAVRAEGIEVGPTQEEGNEPVLVAGLVHVGADLLPLLRGRLHIRSLSIEEPTVRLLRREDGSLSLEGLVPAGAPGEKREEARVRVDRLRVRGATIRLRDLAVDPGRAVESTLSGVDLDLEGLDGPPPYEVRLVAGLPGGGALRWDGELGPPREDGWPQFDGRLALAGTQLASLAPYLDEALGLSPRGSVEAELELEHEPGGGVAVRGELRAESLAVAGRSRAPLDLRLAIDGEAATDGSRAEVRKASIETGETRIAGSIAWSREGEERIARLTLEPSRVRTGDLRELARLAGAKLEIEGVGPGPVGLEGEIEARLGPSNALRTLAVRRLAVEGGRFVLRRRPGGGLALPGVAGGEGGGSGPAPTVAIGEIEVRGAALRFEDHTLSPTRTVQLEGVDLTGGPWGTRERTAVELDARLAGEGSGSLSLRGHVGPVRESSLPLDLELSAERLPLPPLAPYLEMAGRVEGGTLEGRVAAKGDLDAVVEVEGSFAFDGVRAVLPGGRGLEGVDLGIEFDGRIGQRGRTLEARRLALRLPDTILVAAGSVRREKRGTAVEARLVEPLRLGDDDLQALLALAGERLPVALELHEPMLLSAASYARTSAGQTTARGTLEIEELELRHGKLGAPLQVDSVRIEATGKGAVLKGIRARLGGSDIRGSASVEDFDEPRVGFELVSDRADLAELLSFLREEEEGDGETGDAPAEGPDLVSRTKARGTLRIAQGSFETLRFRELETTLALDGYVVTLDPIRLRLYGGSGRARARYDMRGGEPRYAFEGNLEGVDANALLSENTGFRDGLFGTLSGRFDLDGHGGGMERAVRNLAGSGTLLVLDGRIAGLDVFEKIAEVSGVFGEESLRALSRKLAEEGTTFTELSAGYRAGGGLLRSDDVKLLTPEATIAGKGSVEMLAATIDMVCRVVFSEELSRSMRREGSHAGEAFWDTRRGRVVLPLTMRGPLSEPSTSVDWDAAISQAAQRKVDDLIGGLLGGKKDAREPAEAPRREPAPGAAADLRITVSSHRLAGNFLRPDLRIEGVFEGSDVAGADIEVRDEDGAVLYQKRDAFPEVAAWVRDHGRGGGARIPFSIKIRGEQLGGAQRMRVTITLRDASGRETVERFEEARGLKQLF